MPFSRKGPQNEHMKINDYSKGEGLDMNI